MGGLGTADVSSWGLQLGPLQGLQVWGGCPPPPPAAHSPLWPGLHSPHQHFSPLARRILLLYVGPSFRASVCRSFFSRSLQSRGPHSFPRPLPFPPRVPTRRAAAMLMRAGGGGDPQAGASRAGKGGAVGEPGWGVGMGNLGGRDGETGVARLGARQWWGERSSGGPGKGWGRALTKARSLCSKPAGAIQGRWGRGRLRTRIVHRAGWGHGGPPPPPSTPSPPLAPTRAARGVKAGDQLSSLFWGHGLGPAP